MVKSGLSWFVMLLFLGGNCDCAVSCDDCGSAGWTGRCCCTPVWMDRAGGPVTLLCWPPDVCLSMAIRSLGRMLRAEPAEPERGVEGLLPSPTARNPAVNLPGLKAGGWGWG